MAEAELIEQSSGRIYGSDKMPEQAISSGPGVFYIFCIEPTLQIEH